MMLRLRLKPLIILTGIVPFMAGFFLIKLGFNLLVASSREIQIYTNLSYPILSFLYSLFGSLQTALFMLILLACAIGYLKGKFMIKKSISRNILRLQSMPQPIPITQLYSIPYYGLVAGMMCMGMVMNYLAVPKDVRGLVDAAVGFALIEGSLLAFRTAFQRIQKSA